MPQTIDTSLGAWPAAGTRARFAARLTCALVIGCCLGSVQAQERAQQVDALLVQARAAQWRSLGESRRLALYIDLNSLQALPSGHRRAMVKGIALRPTPERDYTLYEYVVECRPRTYALAAWADLRDPWRRTNSEIIAAKDWQFQPTLPGSPSADLVRTACEPAPVRVERPSVDFDALRGMGTAWLSELGALVTALHVVKGASKIWIAVDGVRAETALVAADENTGLAILEAPPELDGYKPLPIAPSAAAPGTSIVSIAYPHRNANWTSPKFAVGEVGLMERSGAEQRLMRITGDIGRSHIGGPILNYRGEVVGILSGDTGRTTADRRPQPYAQAVPAQQLLQLLPQTRGAAMDSKTRRLRSMDKVVAGASPSVFPLVAE